MIQHETFIKRVRQMGQHAYEMGSITVDDSLIRFVKRINLKQPVY